MQARTRRPRSRRTPWAAHVPAIVLLGAALACGASPPTAARRSVAFPARTMGTYVNVTLVTADSAASAPLARMAVACFARIDSLMSNWTTTSEVARLNREAYPRATPVQSEVAQVIEASLRAWRETDGAFDITVEPLVRAWGFLAGHPHVPTQAEIAEAFRHVGAQKLDFDSVRRTLRFREDSVRIDLGGIAKGYAVDVAADSLRAHGVTDALVDLTGNMFAIGAPAGRSAWRIGIRDPRNRISYFARLEITNQGISTSGAYEQFVAADGRTYGHIFDPRTGRPVEGLLSVTVVARNAFASDTWDTPLFVLGPRKAMQLAASHDDFAVVLVQSGGSGVDTVWVERTLQGSFLLEPAAGSLFRVVYF